VRAYLIDEISPSDINKIEYFLKRHARSSGLAKIYWIPFPLELLTAVQRRHQDCQPFVSALEIGDDWIKIEFYVRSLKALRCDCPGLCNESQRNFLVYFAHTMLKELEVSG
jgi:hypothetical protein